MDLFLTPERVGVNFEVLEGEAEKMVTAEVMYEKEGEEHVVTVLVGGFFGN